MADTGSSAPAAAEESEQQITFTVKSSSEAKYALTLPVTTTIADLKQKLSSEEHANIPAERQRLIYSGRVLKDHDTIGSCKIKDGNTVHMVKGAESNSRQNPANQGTTAAPAGAGQPPTNVPSNIAAGPGASNPLAQLTGARYAGFHGLPGMDAFGADGGMGAPPNPDQMLQLLEDPNFAQQMNEAMNNPMVIDMLRNNPMIRDNPLARQAIENPELRRMMLNPDMIRMQMRMQRAMGGGGGGGFPMPGQTDTTPSTDSTSTQTNTSSNASTTANPNAAANPFAALFPGGGAGGQRGANQAQGNPMMDAMQRMFQGQTGGADQGQTGTGTGTGTGTTDQNQNPNQGGDLMMQMLQNMMGGGGGGMGGNFDRPQSPPDNRPPEERYEDQLRQLNDMGFYEFERNVQALRRSGGSVQGAVEHLLNNP